MSNIELESFVHDSLDAIGTVRNEIAPGSGIWSAEFVSDDAKQAARFLGRSDHSLLYTFDLKRWEQGSKLDCLSPSAQLVRRFQSLAAGLGTLCLAHVPISTESKPHKAYLLGYFTAKHATDTVVEHHGWLGADIETGTAVKIKGDPLATPNLLEGPPIGDGEMPAQEQIAKALEGLTDQWNTEMAQKAREIQVEVERKFHQEATEIMTAKHDDEQKIALHRLKQRLQLRVECQVRMALLLWLPQK